MPPVDPPAPFHPTATRRARQTVRVGVGVAVCRGNRLYAGVRRGSHGAGTLALPGGHLELYETWEGCAAREVAEEMGLRLEEVRYAHVCNNPMPDEERHYVTIFMMGRVGADAGEPANMEPDKCEGWRLYTWDELQTLQDSDTLFGPLKCLVKENPPQLQDFLNANT